MIINGNVNRQDAENIDYIVRKFGLFRETAEILFSRGVKSEKDVEYFLNPGKHHFKDPYLLTGMKDAVERIKMAKEGEETVIVYGDYDADGICATSILYSALKEFGIDAVPFVPERADGYGLNNETIDRLIEEHFPELIITVDCGISCRKEIEYIKSNGIDVIVTDHHELPDILPDCTIVNCKIAGAYGFDGLCGAGVAFKLATALIGDDALKYLDFAAIATIADSMPLIDENRDIVYEGVKLIKSGRSRRAINELIAISNLKDVNSTSLAFTIAPRINAAGRMGDAFSALKLMLSDDSREVEELAVKLNSFNVLRQKDCDALYKSAKAKLIDGAYNKKIAVLSDDGWNSGLVGIIAARLAEEFSRPVILFVGNGETLHGSARSVEGVNIFEAISACKDYVAEFGGHAQAAGITVSQENFSAFKQAIENYIDKNYSFDRFRPEKFAEILIDKKFSLKFAKELNRLEPFGTGNKKPLFCVNAVDVNPIPVKIGSPHLFLKTPQIDLLYFNGAQVYDLLTSGAEKHIVFEPNVSVYNNEESLKGYVKDIEYEVEPTKRVILDAYRISLLTALTDNDDYLYVSDAMTGELVSENDTERYGTVYAVFNPKNLEKYPSLKRLDRSLYFTANKNLLNNVVIAPEAHNIAGYRKMVYLDRPLGSVNFFTDVKETFINRGVRAFDYSSLDVSKQTFASLFKAIKSYEFSKCENSVDFALKTNLGVGSMQLVFAIEVFVDLGIFYFNKGVLRYNDTIKTNLNASRIYEEVEKLK